MTKSELIFGKRIAGALAFAMLLCGFASHSFAEEVARVLVVQDNTYVRLYTINDQCEWTQGDTIVTAGSARDTKRPIRALYRDGIVYVLDMIADQSERGYIRKYSLSGDYLGDECQLELRLDDFIFSEDGRYIYVSAAFGNRSGEICQYDRHTGEVNTIVDTSGAPRQLTWGHDDRLYVADRSKQVIYAINVIEKSFTTFASSVGMVSGIYYDLQEDRYFAANNNGTVYTIDTSGSKSSAAATPDRWCVWGARINGAPHFFTMKNKTASSIGVRRNPDGTFTTEIEYTGSTFNSAVEIPLYLPNVEWKLDDEANALEFAGTGTGMAITPSRLLQSGVVGVQNGGVWFNESSYGAFEKSANLVPATEDFTVTFWAGLPASSSVAAVRTLFSNANGSAGDLTVAVGADGYPDALTLSFIMSDGTLLTDVSSSDFADGNWHHVAVCRQGTSLKAYMDGTLAASLTLPADAEIAQARDWHVGATALGTNPVGSGACMDDVRLYGQTLPVNTIALLSNEFGAGSLPTGAPELPAVSSLPEELGVEVFYRRAIDSAISDSMLFKASDGSLYLASGRGDGFRDVDRATDFRRSTDGGVTWTANAAPTLSAGSVSLFERDDYLFAIGLKNTGDADNRRTFAVWQLSEGVWVEKSSFEGAADNEYALGTGSVTYYSSDKRFYKSAVCYYGGTNAHPAYISFKYENGAFSSGTATVIDDGKPIFGGVCTVADVMPGDTVIVPADLNACWAFYSFVDRPMDSKFRVGPERTRLYKYNSATVNKALKVWSLPGGSKPYSVKYDSASGLYWAVTVPVTNRQETAGGVYADTVARRIGVYASPDLTEWWPCGILIDSDVAAFRAPSMEICGDDMVIAYGVATDDNAGGARGFDQPNYLAVYRVTGFRTALVPEKPNGQYLLAANGGSVSRYWKTSGGMWLPGKTFATGSYGNATMSIATGIAARDNVVYVGGEGSAGRIFVFNRKGRYIKTLVGMPSYESGKVDSIRFAADGKSLIVTDAYAHMAVYKVDPATDKWTELVSVASPKGSGITGRVRDALEAPNGFLYVASQSGAVSVFDVSKEYSFVKKIDTATCVGLALDDVGNHLFYSTMGGLVKKYNLNDGTTTTIQDRSAMGNNSALQLIWHNGRLLAADANNFLAYELNPTGLNDEDVFLAGAQSFTRYAFIDENRTHGFVFHLR